MFLRIYVMKRAVYPIRYSILPKSQHLYHESWFGFLPSWKMLRTVNSIAHKRAKVTQSKTKSKPSQVYIRWKFLRKSFALTITVTCCSAAYRSWLTAQFFHQQISKALCTPPCIFTSPISMSILPKHKLKILFLETNNIRGSLKEMSQESFKVFMYGRTLPLTSWRMWGGSNKRI